jgi:hypothetical protein
MQLRSLSVLALALVTLTLAFAGCGSSSSSSGAPSGGAGVASTSSTPTGTIHFAKTKFVLHVGLAFGAFHRYIWKPFRAGVFAKPLTHKLALVKAALATAFVIHELKIAYADAQSSPTLSKLVSPITALKNKIDSLVAQFKAGQYDPTKINAAQTATGSLSSLSAGAGAAVKDLPAPAL